VRILLYAHSFAPAVGGVETYVRLLAEGLATLGQEVTVCTLTPADEADDGALPFRVIRGPTVRGLWRLLGDADVVQLAGPSMVPLALALLRRKPLVIEHHAYQAVCPNGLLFHHPTHAACPGHFMARRYGECLRCNASEMGRGRSALKLLASFPRRWMCGRADANVSVSDHVRERVTLRRARTIHHGLPDAGVAPGDPHPARFAFIGRLVEEKGLPLLLTAARRLADLGYPVELDFVGDGPERPRLEDLTRSLGLTERVRFRGVLRGEALEEAARAVVAVVMPSAWEETAGLAAMEQMMRGRAVVAADIGGLGEVVGDAALKFPPGDDGALAGALRRICDEPALAAELGQRARDRALDRFRQERMAADHLRLYQEIAGLGATDGRGL
jgi:glycosyltransferase involved in cell wall biosynthesis